MADPPGTIRRIDPEAEAERLAQARKIPEAVITDEVHQVHCDGEVILVRIRVTADEFRPVPADLGSRLANVVRANWPAQETPGG